MYTILHIICIHDKFMYGTILECLIKPGTSYYHCLEFVLFFNCLLTVFLMLLCFLFLFSDEEGYEHDSCWEEEDSLCVSGGWE